MTWLETPKAGFLALWPIYYMYIHIFFSTLYHYTFNSSSKFSLSHIINTYLLLCFKISSIDLIEKLHSRTVYIFEKRDNPKEVRWWVNFAYWEIFNVLLSFADLFSKSSFWQKFFRNTTRVSNSLDPDQALHFVRADLGPNCLQKLSEDDTSRLRIILTPRL